MRRGQLAVGEDDAQEPPAGQRHALGERALGAERVQVAGDQAGVAAQLGQVALELVDLLDDVDRDDDVVVVEAEDAPRIVEQDVGVEDEVLFHRLAGVSLGRDLVVMRWAFWLLVPASIGTEPTRPGRSIAATRGAEQVLNAPGHRWPRHALPGEAPAKAADVEPVRAPPPSPHRRTPRDGAHRPGHAPIQWRDHQNPASTSPVRHRTVRSPGPAPRRAATAVAAAAPCEAPRTSPVPSRPRRRSDARTPTQRGSCSGEAPFPPRPPAGPSAGEAG